MVGVGWWFVNCWLCQSHGSTLVNYRAVIPPGFPKSRKRDLSILTVAGFPKLPQGSLEYYRPIPLRQTRWQAQLEGEESKKP